jgi:CheY-like chemotaxis protein
LSEPRDGAGRTLPIRVLLVDDSTDSREMYQQFLAWSGIELTLAADGAEALTRARQDAPDVIVMDLSLPGMTGWEATRALKADPRTAGIPVVALSGYTPDRGADRGFAVFLTKPCLPDDLIAAIHRVLDRTP